MLKIVIFVFPLALDTLALSISLGLRGFRPWWPAVLFSIFEAVMPLFGIALAHAVSPSLGTGAVLIGGGMLIGVGLLTIRGALWGKEELEQLSMNSMKSSIFAGLAISMDELAAGFPMGASALPIPRVLAVIVGQTFLVTVLGIAFGNRVRSVLARNASRIAGLAAGVVFILVGLWLVIGRLTSYGGLQI